MYGSWKYLATAGLISVVVVTLVLSIFEWKPSGPHANITTIIKAPVRVKRQKINNEQQCEINRKKNPETDYCAREQKVPKVRFCFGTESGYVFRIPFSAIKTLGSKYDGNYYKWHDWYLADDYFDTPSWGTVVAYTGSDWRPNPTTELAKIHHKAFTLTIPNPTNQRTELHLSMHRNYTGCWADDCWTMHLYPYTVGKDPAFELELCKAYRNSSNSSTSLLPGVGQFAREHGAKIYPIDKTEVDDWFKVISGISGTSNNWLLLAEQAANASKQSCIVCMGSRPLLRVIPATLPPVCVLDVMNNTNPRNPDCTQWDAVYPLTDASKAKPLFSKIVAAANFTCIHIKNTGKRLGKLNPSLCDMKISTDVTFRPRSRSDIWWWCGEDKLYDRLPRNVSGHCAIVTLLLPVSIFPILTEDLIQRLDSIIPSHWGRQKRETSTPWLSTTDPTYIDSIGIPRGVPDEYKIADQIAAGFESILCWWCTTNKNVDRINYVHYNVQKLGNWTQEGFSAVHEQLRATSLMAFQNRIALDMLLAEKGGVCAMFGEQCCTFIPNNTAAGGRLTKAIEGLRTLNKRMKDQSGIDTTMWDSLMDVFGKYKSLVSSILLSLAVFASILTLCGCCCIPCMRSLLTRLITTTIEGRPPPHQMMPLLQVEETDVDPKDEDAIRMAEY